MTIIEVYEKYKHLDKVLSDTMFVDSLQDQARYDMWQAIRNAGSESTGSQEFLPISGQNIK